MRLVVRIELVSDGLNLVFCRHVSYSLVALCVHSVLSNCNEAE